MSTVGSPSAFQNIVRNEPLVSGPPAQPHHDIPILNSDSTDCKRLELRPSESGLVDPESLSIITQSRTQSATEEHHSWTWSDRHHAQQILDFLWLGPYSVVRDREFMDFAKFTMILVVRDKKLADSGYMNTKKLSERLGTAVDSVDVSSQAPLSSLLNSAVDKINSHLLSRHANQCEYVIVEGKGYPGKVLVCCETGNDRSAVIVAAYLMKVYNATFVEAAQFVSIPRFSAIFTDNTRNMLKAWEETLAAQRQVYREKAFYEGAEPAGGIKRHFADTVDEAERTRAVVSGKDHLDNNRFVGRFTTPFTDESDGRETTDATMQEDG